MRFLVAPELVQADADHTEAECQPGRSDILGQKSGVERGKHLYICLNTCKHNAVFFTSLFCYYNFAILINTLGLQEARASSEIENIVTTEDELFKAQAGEAATDPAAKEVARYAEALREGFERLRGGGVLSTSLILHLQEILEGNRAGFRKLPGTVIRNMATGAVVHTPPQDPA